MIAGRSRRLAAAVAAAVAGRLETAVVGAAIRLLRALGPVRASDLGGAVARAIGPALPVSRVADANLRRAMPALDRAARRRVVRGVWDNLGRTAGELPHLGALREDTPSGPGWVLEGREHLLALRAHAGPVIFVSGHIGNWELLPVVTAAYGFPVATFYRAASNPRVDAMIQSLRIAARVRHPDPAGFAAFPKGASGARGALRHLASGRHLGMLVDQKMNDGIEARFFGLPAMTAPALAGMALRLRCPVIVGHVERTGPARFRLRCEAPVVLPDTGDPARDRLLLTQAVNDQLERWIRAKPQDWLWLHRRWPPPKRSET